jgi:hypothetical protein
MLTETRQHPEIGLQSESFTNEGETAVGFEFCPLMRMVAAGDLTMVQAIRSDLRVNRGSLRERRWSLKAGYRTSLIRG